MGHGKRYSDEPKLNLKKVFAVVIAIVVVIMFILIIRNILKKAGNEETVAKKYFSVFSDNKWGVIDQTGEYVITPSYENMVIIPNEDKDVFLCMYDIDDEAGTYKTKAINSKNEEIFIGYNQVEEISNFDKNGNLYYFENVIKVQKDGKYGLIDLDGNVVLNIEYDAIKGLEGENTILVEKDGKVGATNSNGNLILQAKYSDVLMTGSNLFVVKDDTLKVVDSEGTTILQDGFDEVKQILDYDIKGIVFVKDNKYGVKNTEGEIIINAEYGYLEQVKENVFIAKAGDSDIKDAEGNLIAEANSGYGIISSANTKILDFNYKNIAYSKIADMYIADTTDTESVVFDSNLEEKVSGIVNVYEDAGYFKVRVEDEYKYYNFNFEEKTSIDVLSGNTLFVSKQNGKYGFIDKDGNVVVDYIYDEAMEQNEFGFSAVKLNGLWGSIDKDGKVVISPKYNLEDNITIDFIGKWHFGKYSNMNYYTDL
jgi:hypothetical protein